MFFRSTHTGMMRGCTRRHGASSQPSGNMSSTMSSCHGSWGGMLCNCTPSGSRLRAIMVVSGWSVWSGSKAHHHPFICQLIYLCVSLSVNACFLAEYDGNCNPGILNEFATAAFRFGHSLIRPSLLRMDTSFSESHGGVELRKSFFNPDML